MPIPAYPKVEVVASKDLVYLSHLFTNRLMTDGIKECRQLAERLMKPLAFGQHTDQKFTFQRPPAIKREAKETESFWLLSATV